MVLGCQVKGRSLPVAGNTCTVGGHDSLQTDHYRCNHMPYLDIVVGGAPCFSIFGSLSKSRPGGISKAITAFFFQWPNFARGITVTQITELLYIAPSRCENQCFLRKASYVQQPTWRYSCSFLPTSSVSKHLYPLIRTPL